MCDPTGGRPIARIGLPAAHWRVCQSAGRHGGTVVLASLPGWVTVQLGDAFAAVAFLTGIVGTIPGESQPAAHYGDVMPGEAVSSLYSRLTIMVRLNSEYVLPEWIAD